MIVRLARAFALMLLAWQAVVAQAHGHAPARTVAVATQLGIGLAPAPHRPDGPLHCPVCRTLAHADAYVSPGLPSFAPPTAMDRWSPVATLPTQPHGRRSHAWNSRAPPIPLHA